MAVSAATDTEQARLEAIVDNDDRFALSGEAVADVLLLEGETKRRAFDIHTIVLLDGIADERTVATTLESGARGVFGRDIGSERLRAAIVAVASDLVVVNGREVAALTRAFDREPIRPLTARELDVLRLVATGLPNKTIAAQLGVSDHTVKFHLASIFEKLGASSRTDAVTRGLRRGVVVL